MGYVCVLCYVMSVCNVMSVCVVDIVDIVEFVDIVDILLRDFFLDARYCSLRRASLAVSSSCMRVYSSEKTSA